MSNTYTYGWVPSHTSRALLFLMGGLAFISTLSALLDGIFVYYFDMNGPQSLPSLSWYGINQSYIWQPLSYLFILSSGNAGLSLEFFLELLLDLYLISIIGSTLIARVGTAPFFRFYFSSGIVVSLLTLLCMPLIHQSSTLAGPTASLIAIITVWTMLNPESDLLLFFLIPFKAKWLFSGLLGCMLLINLSHANFIYLIFYLLSVLYGYLYGALIWELPSPFQMTESIDSFLIKTGINIRSWKLWKNVGNESTPLTIEKESKILDFHTGSPVLEDDDFMDQILEKISQHGEKSLTWSERSRMKRISEKKSQRKEH